MGILKISDYKSSFSLITLKGYFDARPTLLILRCFHGRSNPCGFSSHLMGNMLDGAGDGNRTHATSLEGWSSTIELHPHNGVSGGIRTPDQRLRRPLLCPAELLTHSGFESIYLLPFEKGRLLI
jgi:hypothetical protein